MQAPEEVGQALAAHPATPDPDACKERVVRVCVQLSKEHAVAGGGQARRHGSGGGLLLAGKALLVDRNSCHIGPLHSGAVLRVVRIARQLWHAYVGVRMEDTQS